MRSKPSGRVIGAGLAGVTVAAAAAVAVAMSPTASATVDVITISSATPTVGGDYTLHASLSGASVGLLIYWSDNGASLTPVGKVPWPPGEASLDWSPSTPGQHIITASQGSSTQTLVVNVGTGSGGTTTTTPPTTTPPTTTPPTTTPSTTTPGGSGSGSSSGSAKGLLGGLLGSS
ncbi:hypothetical protein [Nocardia sp. NPDC046763]|uniref:hypothetical protein n=1 Tax=Nocardia sp. NPDC046763 TaxID=3155256 RepID=UPI0033E6D7F1